MAQQFGPREKVLAVATAVLLGAGVGDILATSLTDSAAAAPVATGTLSLPTAAQIAAAKAAVKQSRHTHGRHARAAVATDPETASPAVAPRGAHRARTSTDQQSGAAADVVTLVQTQTQTRHRADQRRAGASLHQASGRHRAAGGQHRQHAGAGPSA